MGLTLGLDVSLVGRVADELVDGGRDEGGKEGVIESGGVVLCGELDADVPCSVAHLAGINDEVASGVFHVESVARARNALLSVDGIIKGKLSSSNRGVDASIKETCIKVVIDIEESVVESRDGKIIKVKTKGGSWGRDLRDVDKEIGSLDVRVLGDVNGVERIVVDAGGVCGVFTLVVENNKGL